MLYIPEKCTMHKGLVRDQQNIDYTFSETDSYTVIIVRKLELKCDATKVEIDDMRYASCLPVAPSVMDATLVGSGGIPPDPNLETG